MNIINRKGEWCPYRDCLVCQEGYCEDCHIYYERRYAFRTIKELDDLKAMKEGRRRYD